MLICQITFPMFYALNALDKSVCRMHKCKYEHLFRLIWLCLDSHSLAIANAMPDFHSSMKERLRTPEQGADTVVWLAVSEAAVKKPSGRFFQGEQTHTHTSTHTRAVLQNLVSRLAVHIDSNWNRKQLHVPQKCWSTQEPQLTVTELH